MMLGKRPRPSIKRTTSMTAITVDDPPRDSAFQPSDDVRDHDHDHDHDQSYYNYNCGDERFMASMVLSPRNIINNSFQSYNNKKEVETGHFLRTCGLCKRRLAPGKDIYMYRGDTAFCSFECREQQIKQDERREKSKAMATKKDQDNHNTTSSQAASSKTETIAAA